jgi:uncharacterized protein YecE (DUF72 family)
MDFGRLTHVDHISFSLPPDHAATAATLQATAHAQPKLYVGCPIWSFDGWRGHIFPNDAKQKDYLKYYSRQFNCLELNVTHYQVPTPLTIRRWKEAVPAHFKFCPKVLQGISHAKEISAMTDLMQEFLAAVMELGEQLGLIFLQFSPYFSAAKLQSLLRFLDAVPASTPLSVELRHESWFSTPSAFDFLCNYLQQRNMGLVIADVSGRRDVLHQRLTNRTAFIRFAANDNHPSDYTRLGDWVQRVTQWINNGLEELYFIIHTPDKTHFPELADNFIRQLNEKAGTAIAPPAFIKELKQGSLF